MNTSKQINVMIGLLFLAFIGFVVYIAFENSRAEAAREAQRDMFAHRGAELYVLNCANCHGIEGMGTEEGALAPRLQRDAFRILRPDNPYGAPETPIGEAEEIWEFLFDSISCGRRGTIMPLWNERHGGPLSDVQVNYIVTMITEGRWDLVQHSWEDYLAHLEPPETDSPEARDEFMFDDAGALALTEENCGQFTPLTAQRFRERDPFRDPDAPPTPAPNDVPPDQLVQGMPVSQAFQVLCAQCHGEQRQGTPIAPPLTPNVLTQPEQLYFETIRDGRTGTAMPSWAAQGLTEDEIQLLTEYIMTVEP